MIMIWCFMTFPALFKPYRDDEKMIMKSSVLDSVPLAGFQPRSSWFNYGALSSRSHWRYRIKVPVPSFSKLTMSLVNVSLSFIVKYGMYAIIFAEKMWVAFAFAKVTHFFFSKNTRELEIMYLIEQLTFLTTNEFVKLTMLDQLGPGYLG